MRNLFVILFGIGALSFTVLGIALFLRSGEPIYLPWGGVQFWSYTYIVRWIILFGTLAWLVSRGFFVDLIFALRGRTAEVSAGFQHRALIAIMIAAALLRVATIFDFSVNPDEDMFIHTASFDSIPAIYRQTTEFAHPPMQYYALAAMLKVSDNIIWLRSLSFFTGLLLVWIGFVVADRAFGRAGAWTMAIMIAFSMGLVELSTLTRNYMPYFALAVGSLYFLHKFIETDELKNLFAFIAIETFAITWIYSSVVFFVSVNLAVLIWMAVNRKPSKLWIAEFAGHIPLVMVLGFFYIKHIKAFSEKMSSTYQSNWSAFQLRTSPLAFIENTQDIYKFLFSKDLALPCFLLMLFGFVFFAYRRRFLWLSFFLIPLGMAYVFLLAQFMAYGGTRHTAYLFPFFMGIIAYQARDWWNGFQDTPADESPPVPLPTKTRVTRGVFTLFILFLMVDTTYRNINMKGYDELMTIRRELDQAVEILETNIGPDDFALLDAQTASVFRQTYPEFAVWNWDLVVTTYERNGVTYVYWPESPWAFKADTFLMTADRVANKFNSPDSAKAWSVFAGWEEQSKLRKRIEKEYDFENFPDTGFEPTARVGSRELLFALPIRDVRALIKAYDIKLDPPLEE